MMEWTYQDISICGIILLWDILIYGSILYDAAWKLKNVYRFGKIIANTESYLETRALEHCFHDARLYYTCYF